MMHQNPDGSIEYRYGHEETPPETTVDAITAVAVETEVVVIEGEA